MAPKKRQRVEEGNYSEWAWQNQAKTPLAADTPRYLSAQMLATIATGRDGKAVVDNAAKHDVTFKMGFVEGFQRPTHVVAALDAPGEAVRLFPLKVAQGVLLDPSFRERLVDAGAHMDEVARGAHADAVGRAIDAALQSLELHSPQEQQALRAFCTLCGADADDTPPLRTARVRGELVLAVVDVVMLAKKCTYAAAQSSCYRLLREYWNYDAELGVGLQADLPANQRPDAQFFPVQLGNGQTSPCAGAATIAELLVLIPGCELSAQLRKEMVASFFGVDGHVSFESLLANQHVRDFLRDTDHPVAQFLDLREQKTLMRELPGQMQLALAKRDEERNELQLALVEQREQALAREERMLAGFRAELAKRDEEALERAERMMTGFHAALAKRDEEALARGERALAGFRAELAAQAKALTDGFQAALAERDDELRALAARDAEAVAAATEGVGAKVDVLDSRVAAAVPPTVNLNAAASKAEVRAAAPWPPAEQRASAKEAQRCIGLSGFLKRRMRLESVSRYLGIFGAVVFAKACVKSPGERRLKYAVQNARLQAIYNDRELLEEALEECKQHFDDVSQNKGRWTAFAAVSAFRDARAWRNEEALSPYINCLTAVAVVCAKQTRLLGHKEDIYVLSELELKRAHAEFWPMLCAYERRCGAARDAPDVPQNI
jgi:hypothetical protein